MPAKYSQPQPTVHHIVLKRHHKWLIGSFTSLVLIFMILISIFTYSIFTRMEVTNKALAAATGKAYKDIEETAN